MASITALAKKGLLGLTWPAWYWLSFACFLTFVVLTWNVLARGPHPLDGDCARYFQAHAGEHTAVRDAFWAITQLGSLAALGTLAGAVIAVLFFRRERLLAAVWFLGVLGGALLNSGMKGEVGRVRPALDLRDPSVVHHANESYPSGHTMGATVGIGLCGYLVLRRVQRRTLRITAMSGLILLIFLIGFSRIYLRAHWCSDVLAGFAIGFTWLSFCVAIYERLQGRRQLLAEPEQTLEPELSAGESEA